MVKDITDYRCNQKKKKNNPKFNLQRDPVLLVPLQLEARRWPLSVRSLVLGGSQERPKVTEGKSWVQRAVKDGGRMNWRRFEEAGKIKGTWRKGDSKELNYQCQLCPKDSPG